MESQFNSFTPIELNSNPSLEEISQYHKDNNIILDSDYLNSLFGLNSIVSKPKSISSKSSSNTYNIPGILSEFATPPKQTSSNTSYIVNSHASPKSKEEFLEIYGPSAEVASQRTGISKDLLLAQIALETGWGEHTPGNNIGGIKAFNSWTGPKQMLMTTEHENGKDVRKLQPFRVYNSIQEGFDDYVNLLTKNNKFKGIIGVKDPYQAAQILGKSRYATSANYTSSLQNILNQIKS